MPRFDPQQLRRVVFKVGTSSILKESGLVRLGFLGKLVTTIGRLHQRGVQCVLVTSGAIALGARQLGLAKRPVRVQDKQACAAAGQTELMALYQKLFSTITLQTGQVLLTRDALVDRRRYLHARETMLRLLEWGVVPVVNENDSVSVEEIQFGDNDELSALVAALIDADLLVLLTDVEGLYDADPKEEPKAKVIATIDEPIEDLLANISNRPTRFGRGGMKSKLLAAQYCRNCGIACVIAPSRADLLERVLAGEEIGSFVPPGPKVDGRARWLARAASVEGEIRIDAGAEKALREKGKSLLPKGIVKIDGDFARGDAVVVADAEGREIGRGFVRYGSEDLARIVGKRGSEIESLLGFTFGDEVVHRDDLVLTR
jgi:glutamate 5-kinase